MSQGSVLSTLKSHQKQLVEDFGVEHLRLFGSVAQGTDTPESDVDLLVSFSEGATFDRLMNLGDHLEVILGRKIDLITANGVPPRLLRSIEAIGIQIA